MNDTYFRITEKGKSSCLSSSIVQNIPGMIRVLSEARDMQEDRERLDVNVMARLGAWKPISEGIWEAMVQQSRNGQSKDAFADINADRGKAVLSDWLVSNSGRTEVTGKLDTLVECYKRSLDGGKLDQERFATALFELCSVQTSDAQRQQQMPDEKTVREFIGNLFGETDPKAMEAWIQYAATLDQEETEKASDFYRDLCGELEYIKENAGVETARRIFDMGRGFTLNSYELRTAALLLLSGTSEGEISGLAIEDDLFSPMRRESGSFPNPLPDASSPDAVGRVSFANGETREYTDALEYVKAVKDELPYANSSGFHYKTFTENPLVRKAVDDLLYDLYGEENPRPLEDYKHTAPSTGMGGISQ